MYIVGIFLPGFIVCLHAFLISIKHWRFNYNLIKFHTYIRCLCIYCVQGNVAKGVSKMQIVFLMIC